MLELLLLILFLVWVITLIRMVARRRRFKRAGISDPHPWLGWGASPRK